MQKGLNKVLIFTYLLFIYFEIVLLLMAKAQLFHSLYRKHEHPLMPHPTKIIKHAHVTFPQLLYIKTSQKHSFSQPLQTFQLRLPQTAFNPQVQKIHKKLNFTHDLS